MRANKFRAWDGEIFLYLDLNNVEKDINLSWLLQFFRSEKQEFTGLKDKNGKEIYEGDLLLSELDDYVFEVLPITPISRIECERMRTHGRYYGKEYVQSNGLSEHYCDDWISNPEWYEVIGNIYENPELLEDK